MSTQREDDTETPTSVEELQRALRIQKRTLERSQDALVRLEEYKDKNNLLLRRVIAEMRETQAELEARNAELRRTQERLLISEQRALAASEAKSAFLANMSHEIRTPLNGILGVAELLKDIVKTPAQLDLVRIIQRSGNVLLEAISNVLDISKIEAGKVETRVRPFELGAVLGEVTELFAPTAEDKGLQLIVACDPKVPLAVSGDPHLLRRVLNNLVNNAIKFTSEGEVVIAVGVVDRSDGEVTLSFDVRDTGTGIPADKLEEIFEAFAQVDGSTTRAHGGTGLGLAICRELLEIAGSELSVRSDEGVGSTFSFTLRCPVRAEPIPNPRDGRVLLSENNATLRAVVEDHLLTAGYSVILSEDAALPEGDLTAAIVDWTRPNAQQLGDALAAAGVPAVLTVPWSASGLTATGTVWIEQLKRPVCSHKLLDALDALTQPSAAPACGARILVAEDNAINRRVVVGLLERAGYSCDLASTGLEAVEACGTNDYDLVFMDCQMPEMDGIEATTEIRKSERRRTPILALTAGAGADERRRCLDAGMDDFLVKPIDVAALERVLDKYLQ